MRIFRVFAPFGNAIDLTIRKLFKPFNLAFYLKLAFIAWLANLGQCSGGFNFPIDGNDLKTFLNSSRQEQPSFQNDPVLKTADGNATYEKVTFEDKKETERISVKVEEGKTEVTTPAQNENPPQSVSISSTKDGKLRFAGKEDKLTSTFWTLLFIVGIPVFLFILALCIAVLWVISRGRMMFISALADDTQRLSLREKWRESRITGNSLFKYNITVVVLSLLFVLIFCPALYFLLHPVTKTWIAAPSAPIAPAPAIIALLLTFCIAIPFGFVLGAFHEFGTLLMFRRQITAWPAFKQVFALVAANIWPVLKYYIFMIFASFAVGLCLILLFIVTCCLCCLWIAVLWLPYLWAVVFLPLLALRQYFAMEFAKQFGDDYNVYQKDEPRETVPETAPENVTAIPMED